MAKSSTARLVLYLNGLLLGYLEHKTSSDLTFTYAQEWIDKEKAFPLSRSLPIREQPYEGKEVFAYFDNLLPDNVSIRQRIAAKMHASSDQVFDLLTVVGRDCVGAIQFVSENLEAPKLENATGVIVSDSEIAEKLKNLDISPLAASEEDDFRLSIAGAQEKTAFLRLENKWQIPTGATATTHIFKPQMGLLERGKSFSDSVENEWLCSKIVQEYGIPVANCDIETFEDVKVLVVQRFDRAWNQKELIRLPQEDLCQALSVPNFQKYESDRGPSIKAIMELLQESKYPERDRKNFLKTQVVFFIIAGIDGHAKNFSIKWMPNGFELTPLYDIISAFPLVAAGKLPYEKLKMAMSVGDNRHYKLNDIHRRHFVQTAKSCRFNVDEFETMIDELMVETPSVINRLVNRISDVPKNVYEPIFDGMIRSLVALRA
ncbi:MAG: type II toxin-antitoxin system HipA family toxin [Bdellovibrionota bacterium]